MRQRLLAGMLVLAAVACVPAVAQRRQRKGELRDVQPPWVSPGKTATIQLFGQDVAGTEIEFTDSAIKGRVLKSAPYTGKTDEEKQRGNTEIDVEVTLPAELKPGAYPFKLTSDSSMATGTMSVDVEAPTVKETEPNDSLYKPQVLPTGNVNVEGVLKNEGVDVFQIQGKPGETWRFEVWCQRMKAGAKLDPVIRLRDAHHTPLQLAVSRGRDCAIQYTLPADGAYLIELFDAENRSQDDFNYRLAVRRL